MGRFSLYLLGRLGLTVSFPFNLVSEESLTINYSAIIACLPTTTGKNRPASCLVSFPSHPSSSPFAFRYREARLSLVLCNLTITITGSCIIDKTSEILPPCLI